MDRVGCGDVVCCDSEIDSSLGSGTATLQSGNVPTSASFACGEGWWKFD